MKPGDQVYRWMTPCTQTIGLETTLSDALLVMRRFDVRHLPVLDQGELVGLVTERDLAFSERFLEARTTQVASMMTRDPYVTVPFASLTDVCAQMAEHKYGSAVVLDGGVVVGVFTTVDALRAIAQTPSPNAQ